MCNPLGRTKKPRRIKKPPLLQEGFYSLREKYLLSFVSVILVRKEYRWNFDRCFHWYFHVFMSLSGAFCREYPLPMRRNDRFMPDRWVKLSFGRNKKLELWLDCLKTGFDRWKLVIHNSGETWTYYSSFIFSFSGNWRHNSIQYQTWRLATEHSSWIPCTYNWGYLHKRYVTCITVMKILEKIESIREFGPVLRCNVLDPGINPFSVILQPWNFYKIEFTNTSSAGKKASKIIIYFDLSTFN